MAEGVEVYSRRQFSAPWFLVLLCLFHLIVNVIYFSLEDLPPSYDCAYHLNFTLQLHRIWTEPGHQVLQETLDLSPYYPPLPYLVTALFYRLAGTSMEVAYLSLLPWLFVLIFSTYVSGRILFGKNAGLVAAFIVSCYPITFGMTRSYYPDIAVLAMTSLTFACFLKSRVLTSWRWTLAFGLAAGLAQMTKWTAVFFWLGAAVAFAIPQFLLPFRVQEGAREQDHRFLNRLLAGYLIAFVFFAFALDLLLDVMNRLGRDYIPKLFLATLLFHGGLIAGALLLPLADRLRAKLSTVPRERLLLGRRLFNLVVALLLAAAVSLPWYLRHLSFLVQSTALVATDVAAQRGIPPIGSLPSLLAYLFFLESHQLHLIFFLLFVIALLFSSGKRRHIQFALVFGFAVGYLAMTCVRLKDPRYSMPFLYLVALATAGGLMSFRNRIVRQGLVGLAVFVGPLQLLLITFGLGLSPGNQILYTPYGEFVFFRSTGYGSYEKMGQEWPVKEAVERLAAEAPPDRVTQVYTLVNHPCVHFEAFNYIANARGLPLRFDYPRADFTGEAPDMERTLHQADWLILKRGGDLGPEFSIPGLKEALTVFVGSGLESAFGFRRAQSYPLPDGSTLELWRKEAPGDEGREVNLDFGGLGQLLEYRFSPVAVRKGEQAHLQVTMKVTPELVERYHLFIHLYSPANRFLGSFGDRFRTEIFDGKVRLSFPLDTAGALGTGLGQVAIGIWNPETGERLPITDLSSGQALGDIRFLEAYVDILEPTPEEES